MLHPHVAVESVDGRGVARVPCPRCERVRVWLPDGAFLAEEGRGHAPSGASARGGRNVVPVRNPAAAYCEPGIVVPERVRSEGAGPERIGLSFDSGLGRLDHGDGIGVPTQDLAEGRGFPRNATMALAGAQVRCESGSPRARMLLLAMGHRQRPDQRTRPRPPSSGRTRRRSSRAAPRRRPPPRRRR
jgi:hypothetical protein